MASKVSQAQKGKFRIIYMTSESIRQWLSEDNHLSEERWFLYKYPLDSVI